MPKLLAIAPYPYRSADTRYRISQFIPGLVKNGWDVTLHTFMDEDFFGMYHDRGRQIEKITKTFKSTLQRLSDYLNADNYDAIIIHKEAFPFGPPVLEQLIHHRQPNLIYDMDDAFWTHPPQLRQIGRLLRDPQRIGKMLHASRYILAGNDYLVEYARKFNPSVILFPTVLDTNRYLLREEQSDHEVTIGWVGRWSSSPYLETLATVLSHLSAKFPFLTFRLVGAGKLVFPNSIRYKVIPWKLETEIEDICAFDIGIMPLPDDIYSLGKCGFKLLQYMALGIPGVSSPVGVNNKLIKDGVNGFLAHNDEEWEEKLSLLICDQALRKHIGAAARMTVENEYSLEKALPVLLDVLGRL
jgi:glycosyltransferase involved in cell wall biosynthesis